MEIITHIIAFALGFIFCFFIYVKEKPEQKIKVGQVWVWKSKKESPFLKDSDKLTIIDIKAGWVQYQRAGCLKDSKNIEDLREFYTLFEDV